jgi:aldose 1-epimerase
MAPWVGRLGRGHFEFEGVLHRIAPNLGPHAIHGLVFDRSWEVDEHRPATLSLHCPVRWPLGGTVTQRLTLTADRLTSELTVEPTTGPLVAEVGWHPWFQRPDELEFAPLAMYERGPDHLPTGRTIRPTPPPWDDCFLATGPATLRYDRPEAPVVVIESDCDHWVIFDEPADATCVEPQSGPPDAFNLRPRRLEPGERLSRTMTIRW